MGHASEELLALRTKRYLTALRNGKPDRVPIRPFVAEFVARYTGMTCQEVTHDYQRAFEATRRCAAEFDWDATVPNMVYVWTGLTEALGTTYYGVPGIGVDPNHGFQYLEPDEEHAHMRADEYDALIEDPTGFLLNTWLPRVSRDIQAPGAPATMRSNMAFLKGGMAMMQYFFDFGPAIEQMKSECAVVPAIAGILKAPLDIIGDKLRGYLGLTMDLLEQPDKVHAACEALAPHLCHVAKLSSDPDKQLPVTIWMHRGCTPFVTPDQFNDHYWPTLKPIIHELWKDGLQTLFYAEGNWDAHLESFRELPAQSIAYHVDQGDLRRAHEALGDKFCITGGIPNMLLAYGTPEEVRAKVKDAIAIAGQDGGYILDASAIMQNDSRPENVRAMTEAGREFGDYGNPDFELPVKPTYDGPGLGYEKAGARAPGVCIPWDERAGELQSILGDRELIKTVWENTDMLGYIFAWHCLVSF